MRILLVILFVLFSNTVEAYSPQYVEPREPYEPIPVEGDLYVQRDYLGDLSDFPEMFEFTTTATTSFQFMLRQKLAEEPMRLNLLLVRDLRNKGVVEVARFSQPAAEWEQVQDHVLGLDFLVSDRFDVTVGPGVYRLEVSTPVNRGKYLLTFVGDPQDQGYFGTVGKIWQTQQHFGYSWIGILRSSYIYIPIITLILVVGLPLALWRYRRFFTHVT